MSTLTFEPPSSTADAGLTILVGRKDALLSAGARGLLPEGLPEEIWAPLVEKVKPGDAGASASTMFASPTGARTVMAAVLPEHCSRHNSPVRPHAITNLVGAASDAGPEGAAIVAVLDEEAHAAPAGCAIARAFPLFSSKQKSSEPPAIRVGYATRDGPMKDAPYRESAAAAAAVRMAARLVDAPPDELDTSAFVDEAREVAARLKTAGREVSVEVIEGEDLRDKGYGALWAVGKAAEKPPALVVLSHIPSAKREGVPAACLVGKGIVYDTGGLAIKSRDGKPLPAPVDPRTLPFLTYACGCGRHVRHEARHGRRGSRAGRV